MNVERKWTSYYKNTSEQNWVFKCRLCIVMWSKSKFFFWFFNFWLFFVCTGSSRPVDSTYVDPIGDLPERPRTAARTKPAEDHDFDDAELGDDLLPQ